MSFDCHPIRELNNRKLERDQKREKQPTEYQLINSLPQIKKEHEFLKEVHSTNLQEKYPNFKPHHRYHSLTYSQPIDHIRGCGYKLNNSLLNKKKEVRKLKLALGQQNHHNVYLEMKLTMERNFEGNAKTLAVKRKNDRYYALFICDNIPLKQLPKTNQNIGIDVNLNKKSFITLSNGKKYKHPQHYKRFERRIKEADRNLSNKIQVANELVKDYDNIVIEDLKITNMIKKCNLAKSIQQARWGVLFKAISDKTEIVGRRLVKVSPYNTTQTCSDCGEIVINKVKLNQRMFKCFSCRFELDRDINSARNVLNRAKYEFDQSSPPQMSQVETKFEKSYGVRPSYFIPNPAVQEVCRTSQLADRIQYETIQAVDYAYDTKPLSYSQQKKPIVTGNKPFSLIEIEDGDFTVIEAEQLNKLNGYPTHTRQEQITGDELNYQKVNFADEDDLVKVDYHFDRKEYQAEKVKESENRASLNELAFYPENLLTNPNTRLVRKERDITKTEINYKRDIAIAEIRYKANMAKKKLDLEAIKREMKHEVELSSFRAGLKRKEDNEAFSEATNFIDNLQNKGKEQADKAVKNAFLKIIYNSKTKGEKKQLQFFVMNEIKSLLKNQFDILSTSIAKQKTSDTAGTKQLIRTEIENFLGKENFVNGIYKGGLNKEEFINYIEEIFGSKNLQNGKYKGGKEAALEVINELFGKENIKDEQDLKNIKASFGGEQNFNEQNIYKTEEITSEIIEKKFGGKEKFQNGIYESKPEIVKAVVEELRAKGEILKEVHNIFGSGEFYPIEGGEGVPQGREGCRKNAEEIAMMQAQEQKKIRAIEE
ncbi:7652_t:CDS:2 [Entrophospora sp. SA101]|nr:7652_t:CDS:2 [Entrophospora sp. SA101]